MGIGEQAPPPKRKRKQSAAPKVDLPQRNPLDEQVRKGELNGDIEHDDAKEAGAALNLLKTSTADVTRVMGNGYWGALVFPDEATYQAFLRLTGWDEYTEEGAYIDGLAVAKKLGIELPPIEPMRFKSRRVDARLEREVGTYQQRD
jgi:hypothetical protein